MSEIWKAVMGFKGYEVSDFGNVRALKWNGLYRNLSQFNVSGGYKGVVFNVKGRSRIQLVHRLVAVAFIENYQCKPQVNHRDGNKKNNVADNLEWVTPRENTIHAVKNGMIPVGENDKKSKLKEWQVLEIKELAEFGVRHDLIAPFYDIHKSMVSAIKNGRKWKHLLED